MRQIAKFTLEEIASSALLAKVGDALPENGDIIACKSWEEATKYALSKYSESIRIQTGNLLSEQVSSLDNNRFQEWNDCVREGITTINRVILEKISPTINNIPKRIEIERIIRWDLLHIFLEAEYSDIVTPQFYASQAFWYINGYFPCGWLSEEPEHRPIIY